VIPFLSSEPELRVTDRPFRHVRYAAGSLIDWAEGRQLAAEFPSLKLSHSERRGHSKSYRVRVLPLHGECGWRPDVFGLLSPRWCAFVERLVTPKHLRSVCELLGLVTRGVVPDGLWVELRLAEYVTGGWMSRHTDRADKAFSQIFYFCPDWQPSWGGGLALYDSEHAEIPATLIEPGCGNAVAFVRSDTSWHEVLPVSVQAQASRRTLLVHAYYRDPPLDSAPGAGS
jgi:2-oxoglutarate-Fe(II)-dependent oxygenase superfamily protein